MNMTDDEDSGGLSDGASDTDASEETVGKEFLDTFLKTDDAPVSSVTEDPISVGVWTRFSLYCSSWV